MQTVCNNFGQFSENWSSRWKADSFVWLLPWVTVHSAGLFQSSWVVLPVEHCKTAQHHLSHVNITSETRGHSGGVPVPSGKVTSSYLSKGSKSQGLPVTQSSFLFTQVIHCWSSPRWACRLANSIYLECPWSQGTEKGYRANHVLVL